MSRQSVTILLAMVVGFVWMVVALASLVTDQYTPLEAVTPVMMLVAGFLFGFKTDTKNNGGRGKNDDDTTWRK